MKKVILTLCAIPLAICLTGAAALPSAATETETQSAYPITEAYAYKVLPGSEEWESFYTAEQKLEACYVPTELMEQMTTEALVETILNYPLLVDMYVYNSIELGIQAVSSHFGGIEELMTRPDAMEVLCVYSMSETERTADTDVTYFYCDTLLFYLSSHATAENAV